MPLYFLNLDKIYLAKSIIPANTSTFVRLTVNVVNNKGKHISIEIPFFIHIPIIKIIEMIATTILHGSFFILFYFKHMDIKIISL